MVNQASLWTAYYAVSPSLVTFLHVLWTTNLHFLHVLPAFKAAGKGAFLATGGGLYLPIIPIH